MEDNFQCAIEWMPSRQQKSCTGSFNQIWHFFSFDRTDEDISSQDSAAVIIRRNSQETSSENLVKPQQEEQEGGPENSQKSSKTASLPSVEQYNEQKKGRNPYHCVPCKKNFARSSLSSHVKSKHRGKSPKVKCGLCDKVFDKAAKAQDHVSSTHKVYPCPHTGNSNLKKGEAAHRKYFETIRAAKFYFVTNF